MVLLVVEDARSEGRTVSRALRSYGYTVATATSCLEGSALDGWFECAIFDVVLPDGDGVELAQQLILNGQIGSAVFFGPAKDAAKVARAREFGDYVYEHDGVAEVVRIVAERLRDPIFGPTDAVRRQRQRSGIRQRGLRASPEWDATADRTTRRRK